MHAHLLRVVLVTHVQQHDAFLTAAEPRYILGSSALLSVYGRGFGPVKELRAGLSLFRPNGQVIVRTLPLWVANDTTIFVNITVPPRTAPQVATLKLSLGLQEGQLAATSFTILLLPSPPQGPLRLNLGAGRDIIPRWYSV
jgi:hypothetical protein